MTALPKVKIPVDAYLAGERDGEVLSESTERVDLARLGA